MQINLIDNNEKNMSCLKKNRNLISGLNPTIYQGIGLLDS